jgi:hypothetical protein
MLRLSFIMVVTTLLMNVGMSTFYNAALQGFLWMWLGLGVAVAKQLRNEHDIVLDQHQLV